MLTLHIGLPKTASTFLQFRVFKHQARYTYIHTPVSSPVEKALKRHQRARDEELPDIEGTIRRLMPGGDVLVSDENLSMNGIEPWEGQGPTPTTAATRYARLADIFGTVRVILGIRRQDTWLASRYAESAKSFPEFCQTDFDRRMTEMARKRPHGPLQWLNYHDAWTELADGLGHDNVFVLPCEQLQTEPDAALHRLETFLEVDGWAAGLYDGTINLQPNNVLSTGDATWMMRDRGGEELRLRSRIARRVLRGYSRQNRMLADAIEVGLDKFGYVRRR